MEGEIFSGESVEEAIAAGLTKLGLTREQVDLEVLDSGSRGILGFGAKPARVRLAPLAPPVPEPVPRAVPEVPAVPKEEESTQVAQAVLAELLERLDFAGDILVRRAEPASDEAEGPLVLDVRGPGADALIGRRGETLASLQRIVRLIVGRRMTRRVNLVVDVAGYKQRRERKLRSLAQRMASQAVGTGQTVTLEPMPAYERRIVHLTLRDHGEVRTESVGTGNRRRVTIIPQSVERE